MEKILPLFILLCFFSENEKSITFKAASNDMAEVVLSLNESHQLTLLFKPLDENTQYNFKGNWELKNDFYELTFLKTKTGEPDLYSLFDDSRERVMVVNSHKVKFRQTESRIKIGGLTCVRE